MICFLRTAIMVILSSSAIAHVAFAATIASSSTATSTAPSSSSDELDLPDNTPAANAVEAPAKVVARPTPAPSAQAKPDFQKWSILVPAIVIHGVEPGGTAAQAMPRKLDSGGRSVFTPGVGFEYKGTGSLNFLVGFLKDCYNNPAGALQLGQHWQIGRHFDWGYTLGIYARETPITCYTTSSNMTSSSRARAPGGGGGNGGGPTSQQGNNPNGANSFTTSTCLFSDNLPIRYTTRVFGGYMDVIPTPFLNASIAVLRGPVNVDIKVITNFYLNELGLSVSF